jgi:hypothetical protein
MVTAAQGVNCKGVTFAMTGRKMRRSSHAQPQTLKAKRTLIFNTIMDFIGLEINTEIDDAPGPRSPVLTDGVCSRLCLERTLQRVARSKDVESDICAASIISADGDALTHDFCYRDGAGCLT